MKNDQNVLDSILEEIGDFDRFQWRICFLLVICVIISYFSSMIYVFETKPINYRCEIEGCDLEPIVYEPDWWLNAIPSKNGEPAKCTKYRRVNNTNNETKCQAADFDPNVEERCKEFIYETDEISIMQDFDLQCEENIWKLTLVGTIHSCGTLIGLPIFGLLSDRFGRKTMLVIGVVLSGLLGLTRSFAQSYILYIVLEFLDAICRSGSYPTIWILGSELVSPKRRVLVTLLFSSSCAIGGIIEGLLAWVVRSWRNLLRIIYVLHLLIVFYYWLIPESVRWLLSKNRHAEAKEILQQVAKTNEKVLSERSLSKLEHYEVNEEKSVTNSLAELLKSTTLMFRLFICTICWLCCLFLYNGLTVNSVQLSGNSYLDFILTMAVEIPGSIPYIVVDKVGRRFPLAGGFLIAGLSCLGSVFIYDDAYALTLSLYLLGKFGVSVSITVLYLMTTEIFPTPYRNSFLSICIMFGSLGLMAAPQMPLLVTVWKYFPQVLFGTAGLLAASLSLILPETKGIELPDTIEEAENIGKLPKSK